MDQYEARIEEIDAELNRITMRIAPLPDGSLARVALQERAEALAAELMALDHNADELRSLDRRIIQADHAILEADQGRQERARWWRKVALTLLVAGLATGLLAATVVSSAGLLVMALVLLIGASAAGARSASERSGIGVPTAEDATVLVGLNDQREMLLSQGQSAARSWRGGSVGQSISARNAAATPERSSGIAGVSFGEVCSISSAPRLP